MLAKIPATITEQEAVEIANKVLTVGQEEFSAADSLVARKDSRTRPRHSSACRRVPGFLDRPRVHQRLAMLQPNCRPAAAAGGGTGGEISGRSRDRKDPEVVFAENFEEPSVEAIRKRWEKRSIPNQCRSPPTFPRAGGKQSLLMSHIGGKGDGGHLYRRLDKGHDQIFARFYVNFDPDCAPIHHFGTCIGGNNPSTPWPKVSRHRPRR